MNDYNSIFWIEVQKINPNPYQPRHEFNQDHLRDLADSIRQYGVLQPLVVTRKEIEEETGLRVEYELIAGERRLRAAKLAGVYQVPAVIRSGEQTDKMKLEMAIIENLQREDLNPIDRAHAFSKLASEFNLKHIEIAKKIGKSREYVANSVRILALPPEMQEALAAGKINEGHTRPILMLNDRPAEQKTVFLEIMKKRLTVREAESIARRIAFDKVRKKSTFTDPGIIELEEKLGEKLGTRVRIERRKVGGQITFDFFSSNDLTKIFTFLGQAEASELASLARQPIDEWQEEQTAEAESEKALNENPVVEEKPETLNHPNTSYPFAQNTENNLSQTEEAPVEEEEEEDDEELYSIRNFSV